MSYTLMDGVGVNVNCILEYLDAAKLRKYLEKHESLMIEETEAALWPEQSNEERLNTLRRYPQGFYNFSDILWREAPHRLLSLQEGYGSNFYLYYAKIFPWERRDNECQTLKGAVSCILDAVMKFTLPCVQRDEISIFISRISDYKTTKHLKAGVLSCVN